MLEEPRIEDMEECAHRVCFRIALVTVMHSVTTSATGSIATVTLPARPPSIIVLVIVLVSSMWAGYVWSNCSRGTNLSVLELTGTWEASHEDAKLRPY